MAQEYMFGLVLHASKRNERFGYINKLECFFFKLEILAYRKSKKFRFLQKSFFLLNSFVFLDTKHLKNVNFTLKMLLCYGM